jgi:hypothetical protein
MTKSSKAKATTNTRRTKTQRTKGADRFVKHAPEKIQKIRDAVKKGMSASDIVKQYKVGRSYIWKLTHKAARVFA